MRRSVFYILSALSVLSCSREEPNHKLEKKQPVSWNIKSVDDYGTKSLVESISLLERSCTPKDKLYTMGTETLPGLGQTIGVWADYTITIDGISQEVSNVFSGTSLIYDPESNDVTTKWAYLSDPAYWVIGGKYIFRAYYPKNELNINEKLSNAKNLIIEMNTTTTQRDMLLAFNSYDTKENKYADGSSGGEAGLSNPVPLTFRHAMATLKFNFKFYDGSDGIFYAEDKITSCWMEVDEDESFAVTGYMVYGNGENYDSEGLIQWKNQYYPEKGLKFYQWSNSEGISFSNKEIATGGGLKQKIATAYSVAGRSDDKGLEFTKQDGWLVIIPQVSRGKLKLCFTTKTGGDAVFSVPVPEITGTSREKYENGKDARQANGTDFVPGWRYTYTISISKTDASMNLSISQWNRLDSSFDIKF